MATILEFRTNSCEERSRPAQKTCRSAEIVIFPGVRYERWAERQETAPATRPRVTRDVLELVD